MLVDDQPASLDVIKSAFDKYFTIKIATSGKLALQIANNGGIDLILLDIVMPGMDGYEVCRQLKANPATQQIPIIFLTARDGPTDEAVGLELGAVDFIRKPSSPSVVLARSCNTIAHQRAKDDLQQKNAQLEQALKIREDVDRITQHDLKGPLTNIIGIPEVLMKDENIAPKQKKLLGHLVKSGYIMLEMINRSLDLFKMENGSYHLAAVKFDLLEVLERVAGDLGRRAGPKGISIAIKDADDQTESVEPFMIFGEKMLCYPLFYNLLLNAVEASGPNEFITVNLANENGHGVVKITNSGEVPQTIRDTFFAKYVTHGKGKGTGLGTYSAWLATKTQGGSAELDSSVSGQTSVIVRLPFPE